jgi:thiol peroxidase
MALIKFKGSPVETLGQLPKEGSPAPDFILTKADLTDVRLSDFAGKKKLLNIVPSLDTGVCAASARRFDKEIAALPDAVALTVSADLPFAQARFCKDASISNVIALSQMRNRDFGRKYGVEMTTGPLAGILARAVVVIDREDKVAYTELVPEIAQEPNYEAALAALKAAR